MEEPKYIADIVKLFSCAKFPQKHSKITVFRRFKPDIPISTHEEFIQDEHQRALLEDEYRELLTSEETARESMGNK